jgi:hypothetical protein
MEFPIAVGIEAFEAEFGALLPAAEVAGEEQGGGVGSPFAENPTGGGAVEAIVFVAEREGFEGEAAVFREALEEGRGFGLAAVQVCQVGSQPGIVAQARRGPEAPPLAVGRGARREMRA